MYSSFVASKNAMSNDFGFSGMHSGACPKIWVMFVNPEASIFSFPIKNLSFLCDSIVYKCPLFSLSAVAIQIAEYPLDVPISRTVLYLRSLMRMFKNSAVSREMFQYFF